VQRIYLELGYIMIDMKPIKELVVRGRKERRG